MTLAETISDALVHEVDEGMTEYNETKQNWHAITYCGRMLRWVVEPVDSMYWTGAADFADHVHDTRTMVTCIGCIARVRY